MAAKGSYRDKRSAIERPLGGTEKVYWLLDKLYCLNFVAYAELEGSLDRDDLQAALASVQEEIPLLRARIRVVDKVPVFEPVAAADYPLQIESRGLYGWRKQLEQQLEQPFAPEQAPLARFLWFGGKTSRSIVAMVFHHPIADGRSGMSVVLDVLRRAVGKGEPFAYRKDRASAQDLDLIRQQNPARGKLKEIRFWLEKGREVLSFASQLSGYDMSPADSRQTHSIEKVIPRTRSTALLKACRTRQTSVHGALGAAQVLALNDEFRAVKSRVMALNSLADLRGVSEGNLTEKDLGLYVSTLTTVHKLDANPDFWQLAGEIRDQLQQIINSGDGNLIHSFYPQNAFFTPDTRGAGKVQRIVALAPPSSMLTNIGQLGKIGLSQQLRLCKPGFLLSPPPQYPICVTASSYDERLLLNLLYDRGKISNEQARRITGNLVRHLNAAAAVRA